MNYSNNPGRVRIDLFRNTGKWYATGSVDMSPYYTDYRIRECLLQACRDSMPTDGQHDEGWPLTCTPDDWLREGGTVVCLQPHNQHSHPIMLTPFFADTRLEPST